jgi:hypothetical protein
MADKPLQGPTVAPETMQLIHALLARKDLRGRAKEAFQKAYPEAPPDMVGSAVFHVYVDGIEAALEWVAATEQFLQDPSKGIDYGATFHLLYHLYNWQQFQALLPNGRTGVLALLNDAKEGLEENDPEFALKTIKNLIDIVSAGLSPPEFESRDHFDERPSPAVQPEQKENEG